MLTRLNGQTNSKAAQHSSSARNRSFIPSIRSLELVPLYAAEREFPLFFLISNVKKIADHIVIECECVSALSMVVSAIIIIEFDQVKMIAVVVDLLRWSPI